MCTAATYKTRDFYMGRTLDYEFSYGEEIVITPRRFPIALRHGGGSLGIGGAEGFHCSFHGIGSALTHLGQGRFQGGKVVFVLCTVAHCVFLLSRTGPKCNPRCAYPAGC